MNRNLTVAPGAAKVAPGATNIVPGPATRAPGPANLVPGPANRVPGPANRTPGHMVPRAANRAPGATKLQSGVLGQASDRVVSTPSPEPSARPDQGIGLDPDVDGRLLFLYQFAVRNPTMSRDQLLAEGVCAETVDADLHELRTRGLIKPGTDADTWDAVPPDVALAAAAGRLERRASETRALAYELSLTYQQARATATAERHGIRTLGSIQELDAAVHDVVTQAQRELRCLCNPSPRTSLTFLGSLDYHTRRLLSSNGHPVRSRTVYDARTLQLPTGHGVIHARAGAGEEARFLTPLPISLTVADEEIAVLDLTSYDSSGVGSMVVTERRLVTALAGIVDTYWQLATPMAGPGVAELDDRTATIVRLLAAGVPDAAIAEEVGISQRTVERRVRALMDQLGVTTRFQAGVQATRRGWL